MLRFFLKPIALILALLVALPTAHAQPNVALVVTVRDATGAGVANLVVDVRDAAEKTTIARVLTNTTGSAVFTTLPVSAVRVAVQGQLANGISLQQPGADAAGIAFYLGAASNRLDLRVEADGSVLPDPATMIAPDVGVPLGVVAETATAQAAPLATRTPVVLATSTPPAAQSDLADTEATRQWFGWLLLLVLGCALTSLSVLLVIGRGRS